MSYILDALRRADAERERGSVPGLHAQPLAAGLPADAASRLGPFGGLAGGSRRWLLGGVLVGAVLIALLLSRLMGTPAPPAGAEPAAPQAAAPAPAGNERLAQAPQRELPIAQAPYQAVDAQPTALAAAPQTVRPPATRSALPLAGSTAPAPAAAHTFPAVVARGPSTPATAGRPPDTMATNDTAQLAASTGLPALGANADAGSPPTDNRRVYQTRELPDDIRRELPALTVSGASYSENAASRMLIINGQIFHENDKLAADWVLERIQLRAAVLRYKGFRYSISY